MSIPLDRLYHYISNMSQEIYKDIVVIYRFYPHGSKNVENLETLLPFYSRWGNFFLKPHVYCNDQEPLNYEYYESSKHVRPGGWCKFNDIIKNNCPSRIQRNLRGSIATVHDQAILIHSEKRSVDLNQYQANNYITVYYWSHAVIALDWFRYAKHVQQKKVVTKLFLIYNRSWSGTREYRLGFADRVIYNALANDCLMRVSPVDSTLDKHYDLHQFKHPEWRPSNVIEEYFPLCTADSHSSADFDLPDYESTDIEVVLETLFDDLRLHLTEKTLRPISMGQPFILAGTYGSLKYLRDYGFKTFSDCWDESYDMMSDSIERMNKIIEVMKDIVSMHPDKREKMLVQARAIAEYNKQHFFSEEFEKNVNLELTQNLTQAFIDIEKNNTGVLWLEQNEKIFRNKDLESILLEPSVYLTTELLDRVDNIANQYYLRSLKHTT